jgi:hypothetical protein
MYLPPDADTEILRSANRRRMTMRSVPFGKMPFEKIPLPDLWMKAVPLLNTVSALLFDLDRLALAGEDSDDPEVAAVLEEYPDLFRLAQALLQLVEQGPALEDTTR